MKVLERKNAKKLAMMKSLNRSNRMLEVMEWPMMTDEPDWHGSKNWQPSQHVTQYTYVLGADGKLQKSSRHSLSVSLSEQPFAKGGFRCIRSKICCQAVVWRRRRLTEQSAGRGSRHLVAERCIAAFHAKARKAHVTTATMSFTTCKLQALSPSSLSRAPCLLQLAAKLFISWSR